MRTLVYFLGAAVMALTLLWALVIRSAARAIWGLDR